MADEKPKHQIVSRKDAKAAGLKFYFTGKPCRRGHLEPRRTSGTCCDQCAAISLQTYRSGNREKVLGWDRAWKDKNREKRREQERARYAADPEKFKKKTRRSYAKNPERAREYSKNHHHANYPVNEEMREIARARTRQWMKDNPERAKANSHNSRAARKNIPGSHTEDDIVRIFKQQKGRCAYCRVKLGKYHIDHITAISKGGTNDARNLQLTCARCNLEKHARDPIRHAQTLGLLL